MKWMMTSKESAAEELAQRICVWATARQRDSARGALLLPTGSTPLPLFSGLRQLAVQGSLTSAGWMSFNLDEYWPCAPSDPISFRSFMDRELFAPCGIADEQIAFLDGTCPEAELAAHCAAYEEAMVAAGGIDLAVVGVGVNGHLAFNEPGTPWDSRTRRVSLAQTTRARPGFPGGTEHGPTEALTVGIGTILDAREIVLLAFGEAKAEAVRELREGEPSEAWPVTALQTHPKVTVYTDCC
jgi:glucosamine-6-phosphate deaminase